MKREFVLSLMLLNSPLAYADYIEQHHDLHGRPVGVTISMDCLNSKNNWAYTDVPNKKIYLCGNLSAKSHEFAHIAGMRHTNWIINNHGIACATITVAGWNTGYVVGDTICVSPGGRGEWIDK